MINSCLTGGTGRTLSDATIKANLKITHSCIIEMLATGMSVIGTTHCDIPEVVGPAFSHLLAPERNVEQLAQCIEKLLGKPESWPVLIQKGREHVELEYDLNRQAERLIAIYSELTGDGVPV